MRLYLKAESKHNIGYIPDWLKVSYQENGQDYDLTLDIQAWIDYDNECLSCRCKGDLVPWALWNCGTGNEIDLSSVSGSERDILFPNKKIAKIICNGSNYEVGVYPADEEKFDLAEKDILKHGEGSFEMYADENHDYQKDFQFITELNL